MTTAPPPPDKLLRFAARSLAHTRRAAASPAQQAELNLSGLFLDGFAPWFPDVPDDVLGAILLRVASMVGAGLVHGYIAPLHAMNILGLAGARLATEGRPAPAPAPAPPGEGT